MKLSFPVVSRFIIDAVAVAAILGGTADNVVSANYSPVKVSNKTPFAVNNGSVVYDTSCRTDIFDGYMPP